MRRWIVPTLVSCAAAAAVVQLVLPSALPAQTGRLLVVVLLGAALAATWTAWLHAGARQGPADRGEPDRQRRYHALFEACGDAICTYELSDDDGPGRLVEVNETACMALGYPRRALLAMTWVDLYAPEVRRAVQQRMLALDQAGSLVFESTYVTSDGHRLPVKVSLRRVDEAGRRLCLAVARDVTGHRELAEISRDRSDSRRAHRPAEPARLLCLRRRGAAAGPPAGRPGTRPARRARRAEGRERSPRPRRRRCAACWRSPTCCASRSATPTWSPVWATTSSSPWPCSGAAIANASTGGRSWRVSTRPRPASAPSSPGSSIFSLRCGSRVAEWEELDHIDGLLARTRGRTPLPGKPPALMATVGKVHG